MVLTGSSEVGKSSFKYLLAYNKSKEIKKSTGVMERPEVVAVTSEQFLVDQSVWTLITDTEMEESVRRTIQKDEFIKNLTFPAIEEAELKPKVQSKRDGVEVQPSSQISEYTSAEHMGEASPPGTLPHSSEREPRLTATPLPQESQIVSLLIEAREELLRTTDVGQLSLKENTFVHLLDTGGQPVFQDALPFLLNLPATYVNVFNASVDLNDPVKVTYRPEPGSTQSIPCFKSGLEMMMYQLSSVYTMKFKKAKLPQGIKEPDFRIFLVATHKDKLLERENYQEFLRANATCLSQLEDKPYFKHIVPASMENIAFLVDNLMYKEDGRSTTIEDQVFVDKLRALLAARKGCLQLKMPLMWFLLDAITSRTEQKYILFDDLKAFCLCSGFIDKKDADKQFLALLRLFHVLGLFAYYELQPATPDDNWICTDVTVFFEELSKLLSIPFYPLMPDSHHAVRQFKESGLIDTRDSHALFKELGISPNVPTDWMLQVFYKLHLSAKIKSSPDIYFMPIVLPNRSTEIPQHCCVVENLCFTYNFKDTPLSQDLLDIPRGIFCKLAVQLSNSDRYEACPGESDKSTVKFLRNNMELYLVERPGWIEAAVLCSEYFFSHKEELTKRLRMLHKYCKDIKTDLCSGIEDACRTILGRDYLEDINLQIGFQCCCGEGCTHLALLSMKKQNDSLKCTHPVPKRVLRPLTCRRQIWLQPLKEMDVNVCSFVKCIVCTLPSMLIYVYSFPA